MQRCFLVSQPASLNNVTATLVEDGKRRSQPLGTISLEVFVGDDIGRISDVRGLEVQRCAGLLIILVVRIKRHIT